MTQFLDNITSRGTPDSATQSANSFFASALAYVDTIDKIPLSDGKIKTNRNQLPQGCDHSVIAFVNNLLFDSDVPYKARHTKVFGDSIELGQYSPEHPFPARTIKRKIENIKTELFEMLEKKSKESGEVIVIGMKDIKSGGELSLKSPLGIVLFELLKDILSYHECGEVPQSGSRGDLEKGDFEQTISISRKALEKIVEAEKDGISIAGWRA